MFKQIEELLAAYIAILCDFGACLAQFSHMRACQAIAALTTGEYTAEQVHQGIFATELEEEYDCGRISTDDFLQTIAVQFGISAPSQQIRAAWCDIFWEEPHNQRLADFLTAVSGRTRLILASNCNEAHYEHFSRRFSGVLEQFDASAASFKLGCRKPASDYFSQCLELAGSPPPERVLFIDDKPENIAAAEKLGIACILYSPATDLNDEIRRLVEAK